MRVDDVASTIGEAQPPPWRPCSCPRRCGRAGPPPRTSRPAAPWPAPRAPWAPTGTPASSAARPRSRCPGSPARSPRAPPAPTRRARHKLLKPSQGGISFKTRGWANVLRTFEQFLARPTEVRALMAPSPYMSSLAARGSRVPDRWSRDPLSPRGGTLPSPRSSSSASASIFASCFSIPDSASAGLLVISTRRRSLMARSRLENADAAQEGHSEQPLEPISDVPA